MKFKLKIGKKIPSFLFYKLKKEKKNIQNIEDKIIFINFWSIECDYCIKEIVKIEEIITKNKDIYFLFINCGNSKEDVYSFLNKKNLKLNVLLDEDDYLTELLDIKNIPTSIIINKSKNILNIFIGEQNKNKYNSTIKNILNDFNINQNKEKKNKIYNI